MWLACTCFCPVFYHNVHLFFSWSVRDLDIFRKIHLCQMYFGCSLVCCLFFSFVCGTLTISNLELLCYQIFFIIPLMAFGHWSQYSSIVFKSDLIYFCFYNCIIKINIIIFFIYGLKIYTAYIYFISHWTFSHHILSFVYKQFTGLKYCFFPHKFLHIFWCISRLFCPIELSPHFCTGAPPY